MRRAYCKKKGLDVNKISKEDDDMIMTWTNLRIVQCPRLKN